MGTLENLQPGLTLLPRQVNAIIAAADAILDELRSPERVVRPGMGLQEWLGSDQTGASSLFMARTMAAFMAHTAQVSGGGAFPPSA